MSCRINVCWAGMLGLALFSAPVATAHALTMKECSAKYQAAKSAGTLGGMKWSDFRKAECGAGASTAAPSPSTTSPSAPGTGAPTAGPPSADTSAGATTPPARSRTVVNRTSAPSRGDAVFPSSVSPKYSGEPAGKARMHTCLDQYNANKATNGNGGMRWIERGGGYYSECNRRLKG
jgi:hypothetical protein